MTFLLVYFSVKSLFSSKLTFKIVTLATALEEGLVHLENEHFHDSGSITVENARIKELSKLNQAKYRKESK